MKDSDKMEAIPQNSPCPCGSGKRYKNCCYPQKYSETSANKVKAKFTLDNGSNVQKSITSIDSIPAHNNNGIKPNISKEQMIGLCLDEIYGVLRSEGAGMLVDLVNRVVKSMDIVPRYTYREIADYMEADDRFAIFKKQICSLAGTDPLERMVDKLE